jgi:tetratricopeptide (TPR) repeat protein
MYPELSAEYGSVFPEGMEKNREMFYELMKLYQLRSAHAYFEMSKHIPYGFSPNDLLPEAYYFQSAMLMDKGEFKRAAELLHRVVDLQGNELTAPATYLYAQCQVRLGDWEEARQAFTSLAEGQKNSGLADDARITWSQYQEAAAAPAKYDLSAQYAEVQNAFGVDPNNYDVFVGDRCVVFCPFTRTAMMRMYNMPNIWDESLRVLRDWAAIPDNGRIAIVVDHAGESTFGTPFKVAGAQIKDPPDWSIGLAQIAANVLAQGIPQMADRQDLLSGIGKFVAASLQYDLVTETRDAIGSAAAVKLPQEEVIHNRDAAIKALDDYVIAGEDAAFSADVIAGMMYKLLDSNGFTRDRLIDREPYRAFFARLKELPGKTEGNAAFAVACHTAFGANCAQQLKDWRLPLPADTQTAEVKVGQVK